MPYSSSHYKIWGNVRQVLIHSYFQQSVNYKLLCWRRRRYTRSQMSDKSRFPPHLPPPPKKNILGSTIISCTTGVIQSRHGLQIEDRKWLMLRGKVNESGTRYAVDNPGYCLYQLYTLSSVHEIPAAFEFITGLVEAERTISTLFPW